MRYNVHAGNLGPIIGSIDMSEPPGVLPWSQLQRIPEITHSIQYHTLYMDWTRMTLWTDVGGQCIEMYSFSPSSSQPRKAILDRCPVCRVDLQFVRMAFCCPICWKVFGGL